MCGRGRLISNGVEIDAATVTDLCMFFLVTLDRQVIDKTGIGGRFDFRLELPAEDLGFFHRAHGVRALSDPTAPALAPDPSFISAVQTAVMKLGLNLASTEGPGEFLVIDSVARPSEN